MTRRLLYVAHPVAPSEEEIAAAAIASVGPNFPILDNPDLMAHAKRLATKDNLERGMRWLNWFRVFPETTFIAPWIASIMAGGDDSDPKQREAGLVDDCAVVERCDGIVLCGGRISSGMRREMEHGRRRLMTQDMPNYFEVYDLTKLGTEPPAYERDPVTSMDFEWWFQVGMQQYEGSR